MKRLESKFTFLPKKQAYDTVVSKLWATKVWPQWIIQSQVSSSQEHQTTEDADYCISAQITVPGLPLFIQ